MRGAGWSRRWCCALVALACHALCARAQSFTTRALGQSSCVPSAVNTLTVTLAASQNLTAGTRITLSGFAGAAAASSVALLDAAGSGAGGIFSNGTSAGRAAWSADGNLTLFVLNGTMLLANRSYSFGFQIRNPAEDGRSPAIFVAASGAVTIPPEAMIKPGTDLYGVARGRDPLTVVLPVWSTKSIQQSTPVPGWANVLNLTLACNYHLAEGSSVTVSGLAHTQTATNGSLPIASSLGGTFESTADWKNMGGTLTLTVAATQTFSQRVSITFTLRNPRGNNSSPTVSVQADIVVGGVRVASVTPAAMDKSGAALYGVPHGQDPLTVVIPSWQRKMIGQAWPLAGFENTLTVSLVANYNLAPGSTVTISNLTGTQAPDSASLPVSSTPSRFGVAGQWSKDKGELLLTAATDVAAGTECVISFQVRNAQFAQTAPTVSVAATILDGQGSLIASIPRQALSQNETALLGVDRGRAPLHFVNPALTVSPSNMGGVGGPSVTIGGSGLHHASSGQARLGLTACEATVWVSDTQAVCRGALGVLSTGKVLVTVGQGAAPGSLSEAISYNVLSLSGLASGNYPGLGRGNLTMRAVNLSSHNASTQQTTARDGGSRSNSTAWIAAHGLSAANADHTSRLGVGGTVCERTTWISQTTMHCKTSRGVMGTSRVLVSSGGRVEGTLSEAFSVDVFVLHGPSQNVQRVGEGSGMITMRGGGIVSQTGLASAASRVGSSACASTLWSKDTSVVCLSSASAGRTWSVLVTTGVRTCSLSQAVSHDAVMISSVRTHDMSVEAWSRGFVMSVSVAWMGAVDRSGAGRLGASGCESSSWQSGTSLTCLVPSGKAERGVQAVVTVAALVGSISQALTYPVPVATGGVPSNLVQPSARVEIVGRNLGGHACSPVVAVGVTSAEMSAWVSETSVLASAGRGEASSLRVAVTVFNISTTRAGVLSFDVGSIAGIATGAVNLAQLSSAQPALTIAGAALGRVDVSGRQRVGASACELTVWCSDTRVLARASSGGAGTLRVVLSVGVGRVTTRTNLLSHDALQPVGVGTGSRNLVASVAGCQVLALHPQASGFSTPSLRLASSSCQATSWVSQTGLTCVLVPRHTAGTLRLVLSSGQFTNTVSQLWSVDGPIVIGKLSAERELLSSTTTTPSYNVGTPMPSNGSCCNLTWSTFANLTSSTFALFTTTPAPFATTSSITSTPAPQSGVMPSERMQLNVASTGSTWITVQGVGLGQGWQSLRARLGSTACERSEWLSATSVACRAPHAAASSRAFLLTLGHQLGTLTNVWQTQLALKTPRLSNMGGVGGPSMTVGGSGLSVDDCCPQARLGLTACEATVWVSDTQAVCRGALGVLSTGKVLVTVGQGAAPGSLSEAISYNVLSLSGLASGNYPGLGRGNLTMRAVNLSSHNASTQQTTARDGGSRSNSTAWIAAHGLSAANADHTSRLGVGGTVCERTTWISQTTMHCKTSRGVMGTSRVLVSSGGRVEGTLSEAFSVDVFVLHGPSQNVQRVGEGSGMITMRGGGIVSQTGLASAASRVGSSACASTLWSKDTSVVCLSSASAGRTWSVLVTTGVRTCSLSQAVSHDAVMISSVRTHDMSVEAWSRGFVMSVSVAWMGAVDRSGAGRLGASGCESSSWQSGTSLTCLVPSGKAERGVQAVVTVAALVGSISQALTYPVPVATGGVPSNLVQPSARVEIVGRNLGGHACSPVVAVGVTSAEMSAWVSETSVLASAGRGEASSLRVAVTVFNISTTRAGVLSFDVGSIAGIATGAVNLAQLSSAQPALTIAGAALGRVDVSGRQRVGASACELTVWCSDTRVLARASSGGAGTLRVVLSVGVGRVTTRTNLLSHDALQPVGVGTGSRNLVASVAGCQVLALHPQASGFSTPSLRLASSSCQATSWVSNTALVCQVARAIGSSMFETNLALVMTTVGQFGCITQLFSYDGVQMSSTDGNAAVAAAHSITLTGSDFMSGHMSASARMQGTVTLSNQWVSDSSLVCKLALSSASTQASLSVSMGVYARSS